MKVFFSLAAILGGLAVIIGAWGSHAGERLLTPEQLGLLHKGMRYQMHHALALFAVVWAMAQWPQAERWIMTSGVLLAAGVLIFSGCMYMLAFDIANPGYLTPVGGSVMILGWFVLAFGVWRG